METLEGFAIGWCSNYLSEHLKANQQEQGVPFVPGVMRIFRLTDSRDLVVHNIEILKELDLLEKDRRIKEYEASLRRVSNRDRLDDKSRTQLISFLDSVFNYCVRTLEKPPYF